MLAQKTLPFKLLIKRLTTVVALMSAIFAEPVPLSAEPIVASIAKPAQTTKPKLELAASKIDVITTQPAIDLPLGSLRDSEGNPLPIPEAPQSALDYSAPQTSATKKNRTSTKIAAPRRTTKAKISRKQQLANRDKVANDPSCRWLDSRLNQLEQQLEHQTAKANYQTDELHARQTEWQCLKCGAEGPNSDDYYRCQYRR